MVVGGTGKPDTESLKRVDVYLRFGDTPAPTGHPELATDAEHVGYEARPQQPSTATAAVTAASTATRCRIGGSRSPTSSPAR